MEALQSCYSYDSIKEYNNKSIKDWNEKDCLDWAQDAERDLNIPLSEWVSICGFQKVTGRELLHYNQDEFGKLVNDGFGPHFYKLFRKYIAEHESKEEERYTNSYYPSMEWENSKFTSETNWTVPQGDSLPNEYDSPHFNLSSSYNSSISQAFDDLYIPNENISASYEDLSPTIAELPPSFESSGPLASFTPFGYQSFPTSSSQSLDNDLHLTNEILYSQKYQPNHLQDYTCNHQSGEEPSFFGNSDCTPPTNPNFDNYFIRPSERYDLNDISQQFTRCQIGSPQDTRREIKNRISSKEGSKYNCCPISEDLKKQLLEKIPNENRSDRQTHPKVYEYLKRLILHPDTRDVYIRWEDRPKGEFRLIKPREVAQIWGSRTDKRKMSPLNYDNFAATIRRNYANEKLLPVPEKKFVFRFGKEILEEINELENYLN